MKYWDHKGKHSELFDTLWNKFVPASGPSENPIGEAVRCFGRINYDMGNNGCGNLFDTQSSGNWYDEDEEEDVELEFTGEEYTNALTSWVGKTLVQQLIDECEMVCRTSNFDAVKVIDEVGDILGDKILVILNTKV